MSGLRARVLDWLFGDVAGYWVVICRVGLGAIVLGAWLAVLPSFGRIFGAAGLAGAETRARVPGFSLDGVQVLDPSDVVGAWPDPVLWGLYVALLLAAASFMVGFWSRTAGVLVIALHLVLLSRMPEAFWGWASMIHVFVAYTVLADPGRYFSVDARLRGPPQGWRHIGTGLAWPMRLLQVHVAAQYAVAGLARLEDVNWLLGRTTYNAMTHLIFSRVSIDLHPIQLLLELGSFWTFIIEPVAPVFLFMKRMRTFWALNLIALHLMLEALTTVGWWNFMMVLGLCTFLPEHWLARAFRR